jgi:glucose/arabinose dehydrogenase
MEVLFNQSVMKKSAILVLFATLFLFSCKDKKTITAEESQRLDSTARDGNQIADSITQLPGADTTKSVTKRSDVIGWKAEQSPIALNGFAVSRFASGLDGPRWIYVADNGDVFVSQAAREKEKSPDNILLFRDSNKDGVPESKSVYLSGLNMPFGMLILGNKFYVANTDALIEYPYTPGASSITAAGKKIIDLPPGPRHWTRNIIANKEGTKIYIAVGSSSNVAENGIDKELRRANILEIDPDGKNETVYAGGLRNPVGMAWAPGTGVLWTAVNDRDELGDDVPPDYLTSVKKGGFYGWPYSYFGSIEDPRLKGQRSDLVAKAIKPDVSLGAHTASLGLAFYTGNSFPEKYRGGAFIGQHGSWNRSKFSGYKVVFVPFRNGQPSGKPEDFLTGFIANEESSTVYGRPVGVAVLADGSLLVADDGGKIIWRISYTKK